MYSTLAYRIAGMKANVVQRSSAGRTIRRSVRVCSSSSSRRVCCRAAAPATAAPAQVDAAAFEQFLLEAQKQILSDAEQLDGSGQKFVLDRWERPGDNAGKHHFMALVLIEQRKQVDRVQVLPQHVERALAL